MSGPRAPHAQLAAHPIPSHMSGEDPLAPWLQWIPQFGPGLAAPGCSPGSGAALGPRFGPDTAVNGPSPAALAYAPVQPGYSAVRSGLVDQWQQIFEDQGVKDVEIRLKDNEVMWADSLVLKVSSPVLKSMLTPEMQKESGEDSSELKLYIGNVSATELRFFLRLLYTGQMDPTDWPNDEPLYEHEQLPTLPGSLVSQPPATTAPVLPLDGRQSGISGPVLAQGMMASMFAPHVPLWQKGKGKGKGKERARMARTPPIPLLMSAVALAKKFQVEWLTYVLIDVIKRRLSEVSFESILAAAVAHDIAPVRLASLDFARKSVEVWRRYELGEYAPEVLFELSAAFQSPRLAQGETITI